MVQVGTGNLGDNGKVGVMGSIETTNEAVLTSAQSPSNLSNKKSPSFNSDAQLPVNQRQSNHISFNSLNDISPVIPTNSTKKTTNTVPSYDDHWTFEQIVLERAPGVSLGFSIAGGTDNPMYGNNTAIFITKLTPNGLAEQDGRLKPNDILYKVNGVLLAEAEHSEAVQALKEAGQIVNLVRF